MSVGKRVRFEIFKRDSFTCQYCGKSAPDTLLEVDHIEPISKGGEDDPLNLITSCQACNRGKSNILLDDNSAIEKRKRQLDELQEREEQLRLMLDWERGLREIEKKALYGVMDLWDTLADGYFINETGQQIIKKLIKKYGLPEVMESMKISANQYAVYYYDDVLESSRPTSESANETFDKIPGILSNRRRQKDNPNLRPMYYIRGILKNRLSYVNDKYYFSLFNNAMNVGIDTDDIQTLATECTSWTDFKDELIDWIEYIKKERE